MKKLTLVLLVAVVGLLTSCQKEENPPVPVQQVQPTVTTTTNTNNPPTGNAQQLVIVVKNDPSSNPLCDINLLFNSIKINGVELSDSLIQNTPSNFTISGWGFNSSNVTRYIVNFTQPTPFQIDIGTNTNILNSGSVYMVVGIYNGQPISENDLTQPCVNLNTYNVTDINSSNYWKITNPCQ
jgi:hypothetical protein